MKVSDFEHKRLPNRVRSWDYSENGYYFVTVCTKNFIRWFGGVKNGKMELNGLGKIAKACWEEIPKHFDNVEVDYCQIMPNHIHGIIIINNTVVNAYMRSLQNDRTKMLISKIIQTYKAAISRNIRHLRKDISFVWQKSFYDHVIRKEESLEKIREYISNNPLKWEYDKNNPERKPGRYRFEY